MRATASTVSRRGFLTGRAVPASRHVRPPWTDEAAIQDSCTGCGDCVTACPEAILTRDERGQPRVALNGGACSFCRRCAETCEAEVFDPDIAPPWPVTVALTEGCFLDLRISCRLCTDACDTAALVFDLSVRPVGAVHVATDLCTGCGACVATCPAGAIELRDRRLETAA